MIIFDLDGTLADCEHRRHFVDRNKAQEKGICYEEIEFTIGGIQNGPWVLHNDPDRLWKPEWKLFYDSCDQDKPIQSVIEIWNDQISLGAMGLHEIWSGRCESVRDKTLEWLDKNLLCFEPHQLKMRPIGDNTPDDDLKERWLDELISQGKKTDFVFDDRPKVVRMWRRRGIFVFNCNQSDGEF